MEYKTLNELENAIYTSLDTQDKEYGSVENLRTEYIRKVYNEERDRDLRASLINDFDSSNEHMINYNKSRDLLDELMEITADYDNFSVEKTNLYWLKEIKKSLEKLGSTWNIKQIKTMNNDIFVCLLKDGFNVGNLKLVHLTKKESSKNVYVYDKYGNKSYGKYLNTLRKVNRRTFQNKIYPSVNRDLDEIIYTEYYKGKQKVRM